MKHLSIFSLVLALILLPLAVIDLFQGRYFNGLVELALALLNIIMDAKYLRKNKA